ncbi:fibropellin-1 [Brachionus plicatilis]|uniref:Fibropellin-1 n=1 Tax=Brachionus plicatilis TaxID=10195 RepID=A0A3M7S544_BRAPC|nr:fibropellin-1 [Brachionus plicatilis]
MSLRFQDSFKLSNLKKVNCELKPYASGPNNNQQYFSTCENYGVIKRRLSNKSTIASYITYFFDFDTESQEKLRAKFGPFLTANETLALINVSKQRRISLLQDIDFYSFSFDLSLSQKLQGHFTTKTNLFTLNSLDDLTSNKIFLFGLNLYISNKQGLSKYQFEIFTSKQSIKSQALELPDLVNVNLTFTFKSIELRLGHNLTHSIRLTDQYFDLFIHLLLKAYGSFQLNVNREEELRTKAHSYLGSCISNLKLLTTNDNKNFNHYDLIGQTKSIVMTKNGPSFDSSCDLEPFSSKKEMLDFDLVPENCYLVTEFDVIENRNVKDTFDCQCDTVRGDCSYNFWLGFEQRNRITNRKELENEEEFHGCAESNEYACFNNGTCVDNYYTNLDNRRESYRCLCRDSYTGKRCERFDPCLKSSCSVNSTCEPKLMDNDRIGYQCKCFQGFLGRNCNIKLDQTCLGKPCKNGATCINITSYDEESLSYECMCPLGYEGKQCDKKIDYCFLYQPCKNDAICSNKEMTDSRLYECKCTEGWKGINCTQDIDECAVMDTQKTVQCSGNGYCINIAGSYKCKCSDLFFGKNCELVHACQDSELPCQNGGICIVVGNIEENKYSCRCPLGYAGINCSFKTCDSKPCEHDSVCSMENATNFKCNCTNTGFAGQRCENLIDYAECRQQTCFGNMTCDSNRCDCNSIDCEKIFLQMKSRPREIVYHLVIWPLLVIMVSLLIILFSIFAMRIKKSRATRGTYSPSRHEQQASRIEFNMDLKIPPEERLI